MSINNIALADFSASVRKITNKFTKASLLVLSEGSYIVEASFESGDRNEHVLIGRYSSIGHGIVFNLGITHTAEWVTTYPFCAVRDWEELPEFGTSKPVRRQIIIGNDVWVGSRVTFVDGVMIGNGAIIGANTVVTKDVPPYAVVVGNSGRIVKYRFAPEIIAGLQRIKWWNWSEEKIKANWKYMGDPAAFVERFDVVPQEVDTEDAQNLQKLKDEGYYIYYYILDQGIRNAIWKKAVNDFMHQYSASDKVALVLEIRENMQTSDEMKELVDIVGKAGENAPMILSVSGSDEVRTDVLQKADCYITNREAICSQYVDYAEDFELKVKYAFDDCVFAMPKFDKPVYSRKKPKGFQC